MNFLTIIGVVFLLLSCTNQKVSKNVDIEIKNELLKFEQSGDYKSEIYLLSKEISTNPNMAWLYIKRGNCYKVIYQKDTTKKELIQNSLKDYSKAISIEPTQEKYLSRGNIFEILKMKKEALDDYNIAVNFKNGNRAVSLRERGSFYFREMKDSLKAFSDFRTAINEFPDSAFLYLRYAQCLKECGRLDDAIFNFTYLTSEKRFENFKRSIQTMAAKDGLFQTLIEKEDYLGALLSSDNYSGTASIILYIKFKLGQQEFAKREMKKLGDKLKSQGENRDKYYFQLFPNEPKTAQEETEIKKVELKWPKN